MHGGDPGCRQRQLYETTPLSQVSYPAAFDRASAGPQTAGMSSPHRVSLRLLLAGCFLLLAGPFAQAGSPTAEKRGKIDRMSQDVLAELYEKKPVAQEQVEKAAGYAVFSNVGVNVVFASFAGGHGVVVNKKGKRTYMKMGSAGVGLGLGVKDFRGVFIFRHKEQLHNFVEKGWDFSGQADAAAKSNEKGGSGELAATVTKDVVIYQLTKNGLALQATLQGTKYWKDKDLN